MLPLPEVKFLLKPPAELLSDLGRAVPWSKALLSCSLEQGGCSSGAGDGFAVQAATCSPDTWLIYTTVPSKLLIRECCSATECM